MAEKNGAPRNFAAIMQVGFAFIVNTLAFVWVGQRLDRMLSAGGLLTAMSVLLGVATSFAVSFVVIKRIAGSVPPRK